MPAAYAHHTFGQACIDKMPEKLKRICIKHREIFDFGVHGPDILFYYQPLKSNMINTYGSSLHTWSGADFFSLCKLFFQVEKDRVSTYKKNEMLAYLTGFLAHFTLDSCCHAYINQMAEESEYSHNRIESQYEVYLMKRDGKEPLKVDRSDVLKPSKVRAAVIAEFFPFEEEKVLKAMQGQKQVLHLFYSPAQVKKKTIRKAIHSLKIKGDFGDLFLDREILPDCAEMNEKIFTLQQKAEELYPVLLENMLRYFYDKEELIEHFFYNFEGEVQEPDEMAGQERG